jgi:hypothetical protein
VLRSRQQLGAQAAVGQRIQQRLLGGVLQRDQPLALEAASLRGVRRGGFFCIGQTLEARRVRNHDCTVLRRRQQAVVEVGGEP